MAYKRILIHLTHSGFYDAGFIKLADVKEMEDGDVKEVLLNIFKYSLAVTDERINDAYEIFCDEENEFDGVDKADYSTFNKFLKLLKEKREDVDFACELELQHIDDDDDNIMIDDMFEVTDIMKTLFPSKDDEEELDEAEKWEIFDEKEYSENTTLRVEARFSDL